MENKKLTIIALLGVSILATANTFASSETETAPENNTPENHTLALPAELPICGLTQYQYEAAKQAEEILQLQREDIEKMAFFNRVKLAGLLEECAPKTHRDYYAKNKNAIAIRVQELIRMKSPKVAQINRAIEECFRLKQLEKDNAAIWREIRARFKTWPSQNKSLRFQRLEEEKKNLFELAKNKMSTHITVKEGEIFTIAAERNERITANFIQPYITGALTPLRDSGTLLPWNGEYLQDKDIFQFTARKKGHHTIVITRHVCFEADKPCARIDHDIIVHVE